MKKYLYFPEIVTATASILSLFIKAFIYFFFKFQQLRLIGFPITTEYFGPSSPSSTRVPLQIVDSGGLYRLIQRASKGDKAGIIQELEEGVEPNGADYDTRSALHLAACEGWTQVVILLLEKGAAVNSLDRWGRTPLSDARSFGQHEICKILESRRGN